MRRILIAVALCCVGGVTAWANPAGPYPAFTTGNKLFSECEGFRTQGTVSPDEIVRFTYCKAYVVGVADALAMFKAHLEGGSFWSGLTGTSVKYCPPKGADSHQLTNVAIKYLRDYPEKRHLTAASLVANALAKGFPCS
jgi:Rap1a immunity proteins